MQLQQAVLFLQVALHEGIVQKELADLTGLAISSASRNVAALSKVHRHGYEGHDLLVASENPMERRQKLHHLTPKGRAFVARLLDRL